MIISTVNCEWGGWGAWGSCSQTCNEGTHTKTRSKTTEEAYGGSCTGQPSETESCIPTYCPSNYLKIKRFLITYVPYKFIQNIEYVPS